MDNYPKELAPEFDDGGGVLTPFDEWWTRVSIKFPNVPEEVGREWLHRHWGHSPYHWLRSAAYCFELIDWKSNKLIEIRSSWCNFQNGNKKCLEHGKHLVGLDYWPSRYMLNHHCFPTPLIVMDNRNGHLLREHPKQAITEIIPNTFVLIEGHRRFNLGLYLASIGELDPIVNIWLMTRCGDG